MAEIAICDANILIDFIKADRKVIAKITELYEKVNVPDIILHEVGVISEQESAELGLTIVETPLELEEIAGLSYQDRTCLYYVREKKWDCLTNDCLLRRHCKDAGGTVVWGLELILKLLDAKLITKVKAEKMARTINKVNPEINDKVLAGFLLELDKRTS
ncbi:MAG: hypothetical protein WCR02_03975 [Sphaerochaetaceae bacterium]